MNVSINPNKEQAIKELESIIQLSEKNKNMIIDERVGNYVNYIMALIENKQIQFKLNNLINSSVLGKPLVDFQCELKEILNELKES